MNMGRMNVHVIIALVIFPFLYFTENVLANKMPSQAVTSTEHSRLDKPDSWEHDEDDDDRRREHSPRVDTNEKDKFQSNSNDIIIEHVDFVALRLRYLMNQTSTDLTQLRDLQQKEFALNSVYKSGWAEASKIFNRSKWGQLSKKFATNPVILNVPREFHIALIGYSMNELYSDFNKETRLLCSGKEIKGFKYQSYFKFLELAIEALGPVVQVDNSKPRFLYRGVDLSFDLHEGQVIAFQHFISFSKNLGLAEKFSKSSIDKVHSTVFEFHVEGGQNLGVDLSVHSVFESEEEVLLSPLQVFEVDSLHVGNHYRRYVLKSRPLPVSVAMLVTEVDKGVLIMKEDERSLQRLTLAVWVMGCFLSVFVVLGVGLGVFVILKQSNTTSFFQRLRRTHSEGELHSERLGEIERL